MALSWDEAWSNVQESFLGPIRSIINTIFGLVFTAIDLMQFALTASGLGGGVMEEKVQELRGRVETERAGADEEFGGVVSQGVKFALVEMFAAAGVELDPDEPFSEESISSAVSSLTGYEFRNVFDQEILAQDVQKIAAEKFEEETGIGLEPDDPFGEISITGVVSWVTGYDFQNVFDPTLLTEDLIGIANEKVEELTGVAMTLTEPESIGAFAGDILIGAVNGTLQKLDISAICPAVNAVGGVLCRTQNCHACMDDEADCIGRRQAQKNNRSKYQKKCTRVAS